MIQKYLYRYAQWTSLVWKYEILKTVVVSERKVEWFLYRGLRQKNLEVLAQLIQVWKMKD